MKISNRNVAVKHIPSASNALSIQMWVEEGYGTWAEIRTKLSLMFKRKMCSAKNRGLGFELTFNEYIAMYLEDFFGKPAFAQTGLLSGQLCLMRKNDIGPYKVGNCQVGFSSDNSKDARINSPIDYTPERRKKMSDAKKGKAGNRRGSGDTYIITDPDGVVHHVSELLYQWCSERGLRTGNINKVARGERSHTKGYTAYKEQKDNK